MADHPEIPQPGFPRKTALALGTAIVLLAAARRVDPSKGIHPGIFADAGRLTLRRHAPVAVAAKLAPLTPRPQPKPGAPAVAVLEPISPYFVDDFGSLDPFFAALHQLEQPATAAAPQVVTVLHYGDSPTTADLITGDIRQSLQARFGDAGNGFLLTGKPWAWYQHRGVEITDKGWTISTAVGKGKAEVYGLGGASFEGDTGASVHVQLQGPASSVVDLAYLARPNGGTVTLSANGTALETFSTAADKAHPEFHRAALPVGTTSVDLKPASGTVRLYGESFLTGRRGLLYDSLGLNGASTSVLSNGFNADAWTVALRHEAPALVIINYGTNESSFGPYVDKYYEGTLRTAIARIRSALPEEPIIVMSPMDRGQRTGVDEIATYDTIPRIVAIQRRVAAELHCGFFDTFDAMGGEGTMSRWYTGHPRLVAGDLIHPTPQGAAKVAQLFVNDLLLGYGRYLRRQQPGYVPAPAQPATAGPAKIVAGPVSGPTTKASEPGPPNPEPAPSVEPPASQPVEPTKASAHDDSPANPPAPPAA